MFDKALLCPFVFVVIASMVSSCKHEAESQFPCGVSPHLLNPLTKDTTQFVFYLPYKWEKETLRVYFIDISSDSLKATTLAIANTWSKFGRIRFELAPSIVESDIRVSFREPNGYLSVIGNLAESAEYYRSATLWLQDLDKCPAKEFNRVVLHEFGHSLAIAHELQSPAARIDWDTSAVYEFYKCKYDWDREKVRENLFTKINTNEFTVFDEKSIMIYAVPGFLTHNTVSIPWPDGLSAHDKRSFHKYYK